jgi:hypothetical protein
VGGVAFVTPYPVQYTQFTTTEPMRFPLAMCSDLETRQIKWISRADQLKNGSRPSAYIHWGLPATAIAAQYAETHAPHRCPVSGWVSQQG